MRDGTATVDLAVLAPGALGRDPRSSSTGATAATQHSGMFSPVSSGGSRLLASEAVARLKAGVGSDLLDDSQQRAIACALSQRVALIQGPPGTGKTFVALHLLALLKSCSNRPPGPIIIVSQKNHALDQLLNGALSKKIVAREQIARIGGRGDVSLADVTLNALLKNKKLHPYPKSSQSEYYERKAKKRELDDSLLAAHVALEDWKDVLEVSLEGFLETPLPQLQSLLFDAPNAADEAEGWTTVRNLGCKLPPETVVRPALLRFMRTLLPSADGMCEMSTLVACASEQLQKSGMKAKK